LEQEVRENRSELVEDDSNNAGLADASVLLPDGQLSSLEPFLSDILGPAAAFVADLWTNQRQVEGGNAAQDGAEVAGSFASYLWHVPRFTSSAKAGSGVSVTNWNLDVVVDGDELLVSSMRLDFAQPEPAHGFACFEDVAVRRREAPSTTFDDDL